MREIYSKRSARKSLSLRTFRRRAESALMTSTEEAKPRENSASRKPLPAPPAIIDRKSTRLNSSHLGISYAVFCLKKKNKSDRKKGRGRYGGTPVILHSAPRRP